MPECWRLGACLAVAALTSGCFFALLMAPKIKADDLPDRPGRAVYVTRCGNCHSLVNPTSFRHRLDAVLGRYAEEKLITGAEREAVVGYLREFAVNVPVRSPLVAPSPSPAATP